MNNRKLKLLHVFKYRKECMVRKQGFQSTHPKMTTSAKVVSLNDVTSHASLGFGLYVFGLPAGRRRRIWNGAEP